MDQQTIEGHGKQVKGSLVERWGELTDDDLQAVKGGTTALVGMIQQKTGETKEVIAEFLESVTSGESLERMLQYASNQLEAGGIESQRLIRQRPIESVGFCIGAGFLTGLLAGLVLRSR